VSAPIKSEICERIANGETLQRICARPPMPTKTAVRQALCKDPVFRQNFAKAKELQAEQWAEEILDIVDAGAPAPGEEGEGAANDLPRAKLRVEARKWLLARLAAMSSGGKTGNTKSTETRMDQVVLETRDLNLNDLSDEERDTLRKILARRAGQSGNRSSGT
jgi:hypothetical protein